MTSEQHSRLVAELTELEGPKRKEIVEAIRVARGHGDLSENFEYHAAKNEQALLERRISILRDRLDHAQIVGAATAGVVSVGSRLVVEDEHGERIEVELSALGGAGTVSPPRRWAVLCSASESARPSSSRRRAVPGKQRSSKSGPRERPGDAWTRVTRSHRELGGCRVWVSSGVSRVGTDDLHAVIGHCPSGLLRGCRCEFEHALEAAGGVEDDEGG